MIGGATFSSVVSIVHHHRHGGRAVCRPGQQVTSAADAARALAPVAGPLAEELFAIGLFGASMLAAAVLPLSTAYAVTEAIGFERGRLVQLPRRPVLRGPRSPS